MENFIINLIILYLTKVVTKSSINKKRFILGAGLSSLYSLVYFCPSLLFMTNYIMKILISIVIVKFTFTSKNKKVLLHQILGFYTISFIFAGLVTSISWNSIKNLGLAFNQFNNLNFFKMNHLIIGIGLSIIIAIKVFNYNFKVNLKEEYMVQVTIFYKNKSSNLRALVDTGNNLTTPFGNKPVFIVEMNKILNLLPDGIKKLYSNKKLSYKLLEENWTRINKEMEVQIIPFKSLGTEEGIILGFKPEYIVVNMEARKILIEEIVIGIYPGSFNGNKDYEGLLNYEGIRGGGHYEELNT